MEPVKAGAMTSDRERAEPSARLTVTLCPPQIPLDQTRDRTRTAAVESQRLTA
jgi:hypothetical protein